MIIGKPTPLEAEWLAKLGMPGLENFAIADEEFDEALRIVAIQHGTKRPGHHWEPAEVCRARAIARVAYRHYERKREERAGPEPSAGLEVVRATPTPLPQPIVDINLQLWVIIGLLLLIALLLAAGPAHAQTNKNNPGTPTRANMFFWNGTQYVPVEATNPLPISSSPPNVSSVKIDFTGTGDNTLVAAVGGKKVYVYQLFLVQSAGSNLTFKDGAGTALTGTMSMLASGSITLFANGQPYFTTSTGNAFVLNQSGTAQVSGRLYYIQQ